VPSLSGHPASADRHLPTVDVTDLVRPVAGVHTAGSSVARIHPEE
jgi:hypothetical protein